MKTHMLGADQFIENYRKLAILQLLKLRLQLRWSHLNFICFPAVQINFISRKLALVISKKIGTCSEAKF